MKIKLGLLTILFLVLSSCSSDDEATQAEDKEALTAQFSVIKTLADSENCIDATDWLFTPIGSKACGGPISYLAYNSNINVSDFLEKVNQYRIDMENFNEKWGIVSDCSITPQPTGVICENNLPILQY